MRVSNLLSALEDLPSGTRSDNQNSFLLLGSSAVALLNLDHVLKT